MHAFAIYSLSTVADRMESTEGVGFDLSNGRTSKGDLFCQLSARTRSEQKSGVRVGHASFGMRGQPPICFGSLRKSSVLAK